MPVGVLFSAASQALAGATLSTASTATLAVRARSTELQPDCKSPLKTYELKDIKLQPKYGSVQFFWEAQDQSSYLQYFAALHVFRAMHHKIATPCLVIIVKLLFIAL